MERAAEAATLLIATGSGLEGGRVDPGNDRAAACRTAPVPRETNAVLTPRSLRWCFRNTGPVAGVRLSTLSGGWSADVPRETPVRSLELGVHEPLGEHLAA